jgi:hypothetical protein
MENRLEYFYLTKIRLFYLTKYNIKSIYKITDFKKIRISLSLKDKSKILMGLVAIKLISLYKTLFIKNDLKSNYLCFSLLKKKFLIFSFFDKFVSYYLSRNSFFNSFKKDSFDKKGNFTFEVQDSLVFPELEEELEFFYFLRPIKIEFVFKNSSLNLTNFFFSLFSIPLK